MSYSNYECVVQINGTGISGASISSFSHEQNTEKYRTLGGGYLGASPRDFSEVEFSVTKPLCISGGDPLKYLTGDVFCSGAILVNGTGLNFKSGMLKGYSVNYSLEEAPNCTLDFSVYGECNWGETPTLSPQSGPFYFASLGMIDIDLSGHVGITTSFSYSLSVPRKPVFQIGSTYPVAVKTTGPVELTVNARGYITESPHFLPNKFHNSGSMDYFDFSLYSYGGTGDILLDSQTGRVNIESNSVSVSIDDEMEFDLQLSTCL
jgi:hypothetical protein